MMKLQHMGGATVKAGVPFIWGVKGGWVGGGEPLDSNMMTCGSGLDGGTNGVNASRDSAELTKTSLKMRVAGLLAKLSCSPTESSMNSQDRTTSATPDAAQQRFETGKRKETRAVTQAWTRTPKKSALANRTAIRTLNHLEWVTQCTLAEKPSHRQSKR